ncbi:MAG TPA: hypothetical protein DCL63_04855 [Firmicutes bacterium]|jgi:hypothetical protein|nr:hypothetical protein [Bacillota bacterium]
MSGRPVGRLLDWAARLTGRRFSDNRRIVAALRGAHISTLGIASPTGGEFGMKRGFLVLLLLAMCAAMAGCTFYFGGWGTSSGKVVKVIGDGLQEPLPAVQITYTSVSDPDFKCQTQSNNEGYWTTDWLKIDRYEVQFDHPDCESIAITADVRKRGGDTPVYPHPIRMVPKEDTIIGK